MTIATYSELLTELDAWLNRSDLSDRIPTFIRLFESRANRLLRVPEMATQTSYATVSGVSQLSLPDDFLSARDLYLDADPDIVLDAMTPAALRNTYPQATTGQPGAYAVVGQQILLGPVPDSEYSILLDYYQRIPGLDEDNTTNWLLTAYPDLYLWGSLCMAEAFLRDDSRLSVWKAAWDEATAEINMQGNRQRMPSAPLMMQSPVWER
jgi:hypothetical protein